MCARRRGGSCDCCTACGSHRFSVTDRRCLTCHPPTAERVQAVAPKQPPPALVGGRLRPIKPNARSRAPEAKRREALYAEQMGLTLGGNDDDITHA